MSEFRYTCSMNSSAQSQKALVIDNSSIITKIIKNFLIKSGFDKNNIFVAHDRNQAMMMFELEKFDIVTSGIHLKDSTGIDLLKEVREKNDDDQKKTPFLIISSEEKDIYQEKLDEFQGSDYLRKPFTHDQFQNMIGSMLNHTDQAAEVESPAPPAAPSTQWKESPVEVPLPIVSVFTESTIEAMEQYMAEAIPDDSNGSVELDGYFSAWVDLLDSDNRIQITLLINFPKNAACGIYEGIFGEVDIEQVGGVVQELVNIIGGIVKPKILEFAKEIKQLVHEESELPANENEITWNLGLPESKMGENHSLDMKLNGAPKFHVPFKIKDETFHLVVLIQTY
ncbi:MAG: response regulator [Nitrospina sp.]|nr:response regulator [Nitrospina sp.]MBT3511325.1 response regulator [Nitrospina sp.]MBT3875116.1 response regulator [Nitrospina sp.]MBT4047451.1 response regulator [Nitrospina sp.]MBT4558192.1 response regulator [Nitrospina sp.]